jgi:hypothetical protein
VESDQPIATGRPKVSRRGLLLTGAGVAIGAAPLPVPDNDVLAFRLMRHGSEIGRHTLTFQRQGTGLTVHIDVEALVTLLSIPLVRYGHKVVETWDGTTLVGLSAETNKNGDREWMSAHRTEQRLVVQGSKTTTYVAPDGAIGTSYWNKHMLDGPMISLEDGVLLRPKITVRPQDAVRLASGTSVTAQHYTLSGAFHADVWYTMEGAWVGFSFTAADGSDVRYERL